MKYRLLWIVFALASSVQAAVLESQAPLRDLQPAPQHAQAARLATHLLSRQHYKAMPLDDTMSDKTFTSFLKTLDPDKVFFTQADIDQLSSLRTKLDDSILKEDLNGPFSVVNLYRRRASERFAYARQLLKDGFNFGVQESYSYLREKADWPKSDAEMRDLWRKRVKNDWLRLKLAGNDDKKIAETLDKRYRHSATRIGQIKSDDAFQMFMNAYTTAIDPHTNYLGPKAAEEFDISMSLSLVGIGAVLTQKDDYITIRELIPGGPATLSGKLKVGDRIVGVAQGENEAFTDLQGWRTDEAVSLIRGPADSVVVLDVLPEDAGPDGKHQRIALVRKKIKLEEQAAKKSVFAVKDGASMRRVGVIALPTFYEDFEGRRKGDPNFRTASRDIARLLDELKKEKVDSLLIDLRNNGGGSLRQAIEITGLFIDKGPVVQQRNAKGKVVVESDTDAGVAWDGPLGVLINRRSASASEIFAAAIQDYGRGLIIGEPSFGKGTVQTAIDLDQLGRGDKPKLGEVKLTISQFFRINGGTTQLRGVTPDIPFPMESDIERLGESSFDNALPWVEIQPAVYAPVASLNGLRQQLQARHEARVKTNKEFQYLQEDIAEMQVQRKTGLVSLNEVERRKEREAREAKLALREASSAMAANTHAVGKESASARKTALEDDGLMADERNLASELAAEKERKDEERDVLLKEAVNILSDGASLLRANTRLAVPAQPGSTAASEDKPLAEPGRKPI